MLQCERWENQIERKKKKTYDFQNDIKNNKRP